MGAPYHTSTEGLKIPTGVMVSGELEQTIFMGSPNTFSGIQPPATTPNICSAYRSLFDTVIQRRARGEEWGYEQFSDIERASNNLHLLRDLISGTYQNKTSLTYPTSDLRKLEKFYVFRNLRNRSEVIKFVVDNSFLLHPLCEACEQIRNCFGNSAQVVLEVVTDPEFADDQELVIFIRTDLSPDEAFEKLEQIDDEWWLDVPPNVREKLCIDVEFI